MPFIRRHETSIKLIRLNSCSVADTLASRSSRYSICRNEALRVARNLLNLGLTEQLWAGEPWKVWVTDEPNVRTSSRPN